MLRPMKVRLSGKKFSIRTWYLVVLHSGFFINKSVFVNGLVQIAGDKIISLSIGQSELKITVSGQLAIGIDQPYLESSGALTLLETSAVEGNAISMWCDLANVKTLGIGRADFQPKLFFLIIAVVDLPVFCKQAESEFQMIVLVGIEPQEHWGIINDGIVKSISQTDNLLRIERIDDFNLRGEPRFQ